MPIRRKPPKKSADGKVRITARTGGKLVFEVGYDGTTTWNDKGLVPKAEADAYYRSLKRKYKVEFINDGKKAIEKAAEPQKSASAS